MAACCRPSRCSSSASRPPSIRRARLTGKHILWVQVRVLPAEIARRCQGRDRPGHWDAVRRLCRPRRRHHRALRAGLRAQDSGRAVFPPKDLERENANLIGGDSLGSHHLSRISSSARSPAVALAHAGKDLCSSARPPGPAPGSAPARASWWPRCWRVVTRPLIDTAKRYRRGMTAGDDRSAQRQATGERSDEFCQTRSIELRRSPPARR